MVMSYQVSVEKYDFVLYGYICFGILVNSDGNCVDFVGLMFDGKWCFGNEDDMKIELVLWVMLILDFGVVVKIQVNIMY